MGAGGLRGTRAPSSPDAGARGWGTLSEKSSKLEDYTCSSGPVTSFKYESNIPGALAQSQWTCLQVRERLAGPGAAQAVGSAQGTQPM